MKKKIENDLAAVTRPVAEMSEKQILAEKFRKQGLDCTVNSGVITFCVGMERKNDIEEMLKEAGYRSSWGVYPVRS